MLIGDVVDAHREQAIAIAVSSLAGRSTCPDWTCGGAACAGVVPANAATLPMRAAGKSNFFIRSPSR
jgi:hypothetical protein